MSKGICQELDVMPPRETGSGWQDGQDGQLQRAKFYL